MKTLLLIIGICVGISFNCLGQGNNGNGNGNGNGGFGNGNGNGNNQPPPQTPIDGGTIFFIISTIVAGTSLVAYKSKKVQDVNE